MQAAEEPESLGVLAEAVAWATDGLQAYGAALGAQSSLDMAFAAPYGARVDHAAALDDAKGAPSNSRLPASTMLRLHDVLVAALDNTVVALAQLSRHASLHRLLLDAGALEAVAAVVTCGTGHKSPGLIGAGRHHHKDKVAAQERLKFASAPQGGPGARNRRASIVGAPSSRIACCVPATTRIRSLLILRNMSVHKAVASLLLSEAWTPVLAHIITLAATADRAVVTATLEGPVIAGSDPRVITHEPDAARVLIDDSVLDLLPGLYRTAAAPAGQVAGGPRFGLSPAPAAVASASQLAAAAGHNSRGQPAPQPPPPRNAAVGGSADRLTRVSVTSVAGPSAMRAGAEALLHARFGGAGGATPASDDAAAAPLPEAVHLVGRSDLEAERAAETGFCFIALAAQTLCNVASQAHLHAALVATGAALALISASESPFCAPDLRTACLRALCELAIEDRAPAGGAGAAAADDGEDGATPRRSQGGGGFGAGGDDGEDGPANMVSTGAVSALIAMMGNSAESANDSLQSASHTILAAPVGGGSSGAAVPGGGKSRRASLDTMAPHHESHPIPSPSGHGGHGSRRGSTNATMAARPYTAATEPEHDDALLAAGSRVGADASMLLYAVAPSDWECEEGQDGPDALAGAPAPGESPDAPSPAAASAANATDPRTSTALLARLNGSMARRGTRLAYHAFPARASVHEFYLLTQVRWVMGGEIESSGVHRLPAWSALAAAALGR